MGVTGVLVALGEGSVAGKEKCRAAKGRRRLGNWDDGYQDCGALRRPAREWIPSPLKY